MSDRRAFTADRALAQEYQRLTAELRSVARRAAWPTPVQIDAASVPSASTPAPTYVVDSSIDSYDASGVSIEVASLSLEPGRWYVVATSSQRFARTGAPVAYAWQYLLVDGVVVRSLSMWDYWNNEPSQISHRSSWTLEAPLGGADVTLRVAALWTWFGVAEPAPTQTLTQAQLVAYPG